MSVLVGTIHVPLYLSEQALWIVYPDFSAGLAYAELNSAGRIFKRDFPCTSLRGLGMSEPKQSPSSLAKSVALSKDEVC